MINNVGLKFPPFILFHHLRKHNGHDIYDITFCCPLRQLNCVKCQTKYDKSAYDMVAHCKSCNSKTRGHLSHTEDDMDEFQSCGINIALLGPYESTKFSAFFAEILKIMVLPSDNTQLFKTIDLLKL